MKEPDISNNAQQNQEKESAADMKRALSEFDQARPRNTGPNGSGGIPEDEGATHTQKDSGDDTLSNVPPRKLTKMAANKDPDRDGVKVGVPLSHLNPRSEHPA